MRTLQRFPPPPEPPKVEGLNSDKKGGLHIICKEGALGSLSTIIIGEQVEIVGAMIYFGELSGGLGCKNFECSQWGSNTFRIFYLTCSRGTAKKSLFSRRGCEIFSISHHCTFQNPIPTFASSLKNMKHNMQVIFLIILSAPVGI